MLFDLDGTLADTERLQWRAYRETLARWGVEIELDEYAQRFIATGGGPEWACRTWRLPVTPAALRAAKAEVYARYVPQDVQPCPGAAAAVARLAPAFALAVVTNSLRAETEAILDHLGVARWLRAVVTREDYAQPKPAPDAYLEAARRLGVDAAACMVVEDTPRGAQAARAAGMQVVVVPSALTADEDFGPGVRRVQSLECLTPARLRAWATDPLRRGGGHRRLSRPRRRR